MNMIPIPCDINSIKEDDIIDMSKLNFEASESQKKRYAFIYLRNVGFKNQLSFDQCSYNDKEEYLKTFLSANVNIEIEILASTWIEILIYNAGLNIENLIFPSILSLDEIKLFSRDNINFINKVRRLINSLTLYAVVQFNSHDQMFDTSTIEYTDDTEIKLTNLYQLAKYSAFTLITEPMPPAERSLIYYKQLFDNGENAYSLDRLTKLIPMFELLSILTAPQEYQKSFVELAEEKEE